MWELACFEAVYHPKWLPQLHLDCFLDCGLEGWWWCWGSCSLVGCLGELLPHPGHIPWVERLCVGHTYVTGHMWTTFWSWFSPSVLGMGLSLSCLRGKYLYLLSHLAGLRLHVTQGSRANPGSGRDTCFAGPQRGFLLFPLPLPWRLTALF